MPKAYLLERSQIVPRPRDEVFSFFSDAKNLERITPDFLQFRIVTPAPVEMRPGTLIDYRLKLFGLPLAWRTRIETFEPPHRFVDLQLRGPYALWHHLHEFRETPEGTEMIDRVEYRLPLGIVGNVAHTLWVRRTLQKIFDHRREMIEGIFR